MVDDPRVVPTRSKWLVPLIAVVLIISLGGVIWWQISERACNDWRTEFRALAAQAQEQLDADTYDRKAWVDRFASLHRDQPDGCPSPGLTLEP